MEPLTGAPPGGMSGGNGPGKFVDGKTWRENRNVVEDAMMNCLSLVGRSICSRHPSLSCHCEESWCWDSRWE